jgi:hypothetical protein
LRAKVENHYSFYFFGHFKTLSFIDSSSKEVIDTDY